MAMLHTLQSKSDKEKAALAMAGSVMVTGLLFTTWGYNFAHSGKINNLASSAAGVASTVEEAKLGENFNTMLSQFKALDLTGEEQGQQNIEQVAAAAGARHINVFQQDDGMGDDAPQKYGDNPADVLY